MKGTIKLLLLLGLSMSIFGCEDLTNELLNTLELEQSKYVVDAREQTLDIKVQTNAEIAVVSDADWIEGSVVSVNDSTTYIRLNIAGYDNAESDRIGTVDVKLLNTDIVRTLIITQKYRLLVQTDRNWYSLTPDEQTFEVSLKSNIEDYVVTISQEGEGWLSQVQNPSTKAMTEYTLTFSALENEGDSTRYADIILSIPESNEADTIHVEQFGLNMMFLPYLLRTDSKCQLFSQALIATRLSDSLEQYIDPAYPGVSFDSAVTTYYLEGGKYRYQMRSFHTAYDQWYYIGWPDERLFKYTLFVVPDSILSSQYNIKDLDALRTFAMNIYPEGAGLPDDDRNSSLNQLISYHILPCALPYDQLNTSFKDIVNNYVKWDEYDIEDFYETLLPHSIMRISTPKGADNNALGIYINRKGTVKNGLEFRGTRISASDEYVKSNQALNGVYHYVDGLLLYDRTTRDGALSTRIRVLTTTLSPDYINSGAHAQYSDSQYQLAYHFRQRFCKNVYYDDRCSNMTVCPRYKYAPLGEYSFIRGEEIDIAYKLPAVACDGNYEIRVFYSNIDYANEEIITQFSLFENDTPNLSGDFRSWNWVACGDAVDLQKSPEKWVADNDASYEGMTQEQRKEAILANDMALRESGYMKGMDIYSCFDNDETLRDDVRFLRKIVTNTYMYSNRDYYLRIEATMVGGRPYLYIPCIELVPKHIYNGVTPEDWH